MRTKPNRTALGGEGERLDETLYLDRPMIGSQLRLRRCRESIFHGCLNSRFQSQYYIHTAVQPEGEAGIQGFLQLFHHTAFDLPDSGSRIHDLFQNLYPIGHSPPSRSKPGMLAPCDVPGTQIVSLVTVSSQNKRKEAHVRIGSLILPPHAPPLPATPPAIDGRSTR